MTSLVPVVPAGGNTISPANSETVEILDSETSSVDSSRPKRANPAKRWCFTLNNYTDSDISAIGSKFQGSEWIAGFEVGENNTPHLQGYVEFSKKIRPMSLGLSSSIHWEVARGDRKSNIEYCSKDGNLVPGSTLRPPRPLPTIDLYGWQLDCRAAMLEEPDNRTINWYWEPDGGMGKSSMVRWCVQNLRCVMCAGKASDMKYMIVKYEEKNGFFPDIVIFDVPRVSYDFISYQGIEEIKNGCFASSKFECAMVVMPYPHVFVFANHPPDTSKMSSDRWNVVDIRPPRPSVPRWGYDYEP